MKLKYLFLFIITYIIFSCKNDPTLQKPIVEYNYWGDEIICNDTDMTLSIEMLGENGINRMIALDPDGKDTLGIPVLTYRLDACIQNSSEVRIFSEGEMIAKFVKGGEWLTEYEYEELEYPVVIDGKKWIEDKPWPRYRYHINERLISSGAISDSIE